MDRESASFGLDGDANGANFEAVWHALVEALAAEPPDLERFEAIALHLPWTVLLKDGQGRALAGNRALTDMIELPLAVLRGRSYDELAREYPHLALQSPSVQSADEAAWAAGARLDFLRHQVSRDGSLLALRVHKQGFAGPDGRRRHLLTVAGTAQAATAGESQHVIADHLYRLLAAHTSDLVLVLEPDGRCRYASPSVERLLGDAPRSWLGTRLEDHAPPGDAPALADWRGEAIAAAPALLPARRQLLIGSGGLERWFDARLTPMQDDAGQPGRVTGLVLTGRDVTESHRALEALQATDRRLAMGLHMTRVGVYDIDLARGSAWFSAEFERLLGHPPGAFGRIWRRWERQVHPDDRSRAAAIRRDVLSGRVDRWDLELRHRRPAGDDLWVRARGQVLHQGEDGRPRQLIGTMQDIDERVRRNEQLSRAEQRLALALRVCRTGIFEVDLETRVVYTDAVLGDILGLGPVERRGTLDRYRPLVDPADHAKATGLLDRVRRGLQVPLDEVRIRRANDGALRWLELSAAPVRIDGRACLLGAAWDVTERKTADQARRALAQREAFLVRLADAVQTLDDPQAVAVAATSLLGQRLDVNRCGLSVFAGHGARVVAEWHRGVAPIGEQLRVAVHGSALARIAEGGDQVVVHDVDSDARLSVHERQACAAAEVRAFVRVMLRESGRAVGAVGVHSRAPRHWHAAEVELVREAGERTWAYYRQVRAQAALRASEQHYRTLFETMSEGFALGELVRGADGEVVDLRMLELNSAFESLTGLRREDCVGRRVRDVIAGLDPIWWRATERAVATGSPQHLEAFVPALQRWYQATAFPWGVDRFGMLFADITARKQADAALRAAAHRQAFLLGLGDALRPLHDADEIQSTAARLLADHLGADRVGFAEDGGDGQTLVVTRQHGPSMPSLLGRHRPDDFGAAVAADLRAGRTIVLADSSADPRLTPAAQAAHAKVNARATVAVPLVKQARLSAILFVQSRAPRAWQADEVSLAEEVAERLWSALERSRAEAALRASEQRQGFLVRLADAVRPLTDPRVLQQEAARLLGEHLGASRVVWWSLQGHEAVMSASWSRGVPALLERTPLSTFGPGIVAAYRTGDLLAVPDVTREPRIDAAALGSYRAVEIAAFAGLMLMREGRWVAVFEVHQAVPRRWSSGEVELIREVAERLWTAAQRALAEAAVRENESRQQFLLRLSDALARVHGPHAVQTTAARLLAGRLRVNRVAYLVVEGDAFVVEADHAVGVGRLAARLPAGSFGGLGLGQPTGDAVVVDDVGVHPGLSAGDREQAALAGAGAFVAVPLVKADRLVASLVIQSAQPRTWMTTDVALVREVAERTWAAVERARAEVSLAEAQAQLRDLAARQEAERDLERQRLALDVHDELGQQLTALKLQLDLLEGSLADRPTPDPATPRAALQRMQRLLDTTMEVTRDIAARLRPPGGGLGLAAGVIALAEEFSLRTDLPCEVRCITSPSNEAGRGARTGVVDARTETDADTGTETGTDAGTDADTAAERIDAAIPNETVGALLRIVQESLTNIARHAQASRVGIHLRLDGDELRLEVIDDGKGFDPARVATGRLGLIGMRERAARIRANIDWQRGSHCGTIVRVRWPSTTSEET
ncbi:MAG: PAS domain-containing protein [Ideonella sp.]|nr:PAS domain-containing protein [Ideonella sp.]